MGFIKVANETMCRPIRALTQMRGYDVSQHVLASFGGAGGQHACAIARTLGMKTIFMQRYSGVLSAVGIGLAEVVAEEQVCMPPLRATNISFVFCWGTALGSALLQCPCYMAFHRRGLPRGRAIRLSCYVTPKGEDAWLRSSCMQLWDDSLSLVFCMI